MACPSRTDIADVTYFLHDGSAMDVEAAKRATTVYLVNKRIDMVPKLLSESVFDPPPPPPPHALLVFLKE